MIQHKPEVLITGKFPHAVIKSLGEVAEVHQWDGHPHDLMPRAEVMKLVGRMSAIINQAELKVDEELLSAGAALKIVANVSIGVDNLDLDQMTRRGVWASNTPGHFDYPVAEYAIGGIIIIIRRLLEADRFVRSGEWNSFQPGRWDGDGLRNKTLGLIGMGNIGKSLARLGSCLGMNVIYYNQSKSTPEYEWTPLSELLSRADVVSVHVPHSTETHEMIGAAEFAAMKPGAIFVNTSRGKVVSEPDLVRFLTTGHLGGAVLDVFFNEPQVPEPLISMPNVLLSPHVAGGTRAGRIACYQMAVANVMAVLAGNKPVNALNQI
ncbi:2-hydroxyacid dehydrogenase [Dyadobacter sp. CY323]|uniref:2-hydroxyacid dehydrogenase n=1 Tax=Dyadobacter sp. CY323 TaxID=2907302 RepID=UPI001F3B5C41|nr:NAD(P)-dependent oxidoreductase [Dyadobacter sp. CY323]MCE6989703.1 NAD(P)-binding domain-containing protein [Dyadobacter sp. CY323]